MTLETLARMVEAMRKAQRDYFASGKDRDALERSRHHERLVDEALREVREGPRPVQAGLFAPEGGA